MLEDTTGALVDFQTALDLDPEYSDVYMNRGILYSEWNKHDTAIINYNKVIELNPLDAGAYINRSLSNYHLDKKDLTILDLDTAIQIEPDNSLALFNRALIKNETGKSFEAIKDLDKVIRLNPQNILTYFNRGLIKLKVHDLQGAFIDFTYAIDIYPNFAKAYLNRSIVRQKLNDISGALADKEQADKIIENVRQNKDSYVSYADTTENFQKLITLKSSNRFYNNPLFNEQIIAESNYKMLFGNENSKYFERISVVSDFIELKKGNISELGIVIENELQTIYETGFINTEIERLDKDYSSSKNKTNNLILSSIYKSLQKNFNGALSDLDIAIKNDPDNFMLYFNRANIRSEMIDYIKLLEQENEVMLTNPASNTSSINTIKSNESYTDYNQVIADYYKALQLSPEFHLSAFNLANTYLKTREYRKAISLYNEVIKTEPIFAEAFYNRGLTYIYLKESENGCMDMSVAGELGLQKAYTVIARFCEN
jgi:tetratricopeptide (TPR) repeat protein